MSVFIHRSSNVEYRFFIIEYRIFNVQHFRVDGDIFENAPRVDADLFDTDKNKMRFQIFPDTCGRGQRTMIFCVESVSSLLEAVKSR